MKLSEMTGGLDLAIRLVLELAGMVVMVCNHSEELKDHAKSPDILLVGFLRRRREQEPHSCGTVVNKLFNLQIQLQLMTIPRARILPIWTHSIALLKSLAGEVQKTAAKELDTTDTTATIPDSRSG
jgi:hypothetical protein